MLGILSPVGDHVKSKTAILEKQLLILEKLKRRSLTSIIVTILTTSIEFCSIIFKTHSSETSELGKDSQYSKTL